MLEKIKFFSGYRITSLFVFLFMLSVPATGLIAQDDDVDDVEEYWGDDEEYEEESHVAEVADEDDDVFPEFVSIIDSFLGELPPDEVTAFTQSEGFEIYRQVASDPGSSSEEERSEFFSVVDSLLGGMPDDAVLEFTESDDFDVYRVIGAMYS